MTDFDFKPKETRTEFGWYGKNKLPHLDAEHFTQFVTFRLCDSMPQEVIERWREECLNDSVFRKRVEVYLDSGHGACWLKQPRIAQLVKDALLYNDGKRFDLAAWVIMPNHVHALFTPLKGIHLPDALHSIKSFAAQKANEMLNRKGKFWQHESFDRYIRNYRHYASVIRYIEDNPVKAGLCDSADQWPYSSAFKNE